MGHENKIKINFDDIHEISPDVGRATDVDGHSYRLSDIIINYNLSTTGEKENINEPPSDNKENETRAKFPEFTGYIAINCSER